MFLETYTTLILFKNIIIYFMFKHIGNIEKIVYNYWPHRSFKSSEAKHYEQEVIM